MLPWILKLLLTFNLMNVATRPDFIAYRCDHLKVFTNFLCRKVLGLQGVTWTLKTKEDYDDAVKKGWIPIFEGFNP